MYFSDGNSICAIFCVENLFLTVSLFFFGKSNCFWFTRNSWAIAFLTITNILQVELLYSGLLTWICFLLSNLVLFPSLGKLTEFEKTICVSQTRGATVASFIHNCQKILLIPKCRPMHENLIETLQRWFRDKQEPSFPTPIYCCPTQISCSPFLKKLSISDM